MAVTTENTVNNLTRERDSLKRTIYALCGWLGEMAATQVIDSWRLVDPKAQASLMELPEAVELTVKSRRRHPSNGNLPNFFDSVLATLTCAGAVIRYYPHLTGAKLILRRQI